MENYYYYCCCSTVREIRRVAWLVFVLPLAAAAAKNYSPESPPLSSVSAFSEPCLSGSPSRCSLLIVAVVAVVAASPKPVPMPIPRHELSLRSSPHWRRKSRTRYCCCDSFPGSFPRSASGTLCLSGWRRRRRSCHCTAGWSCSSGSCTWGTQDSACGPRGRLGSSQSRDWVCGAQQPPPQVNWSPWPTVHWWTGIVHSPCSSWPSAVDWCRTSPEAIVTVASSSAGGLSLFAAVVVW